MSPIVALEVDAPVLATEGRIIGTWLVVLTAKGLSPVSCDAKVIKAQVLIDAHDWDRFYKIVTVEDRLDEK